MAAGIGLKDCSKSTFDDFLEHYGLLTDYILFECRNDAGEEQGLAVGEIIRRFKPDEDGGFIQIRYVQCSDEYYRHWVESQDASTQRHHLCQHTYKACLRKVGHEMVVHVPKWAPISKSECDAILKEWRLKPLVVGPGTYKGRPLVEEGSKATAAKWQPKKPPGSGGDRYAYGLEDEDFDSEDLISQDEEKPGHRGREKEGVKRFTSPDPAPKRHRMESRPRSRPRGRSSRAKEEERASPRKRRSRTPEARLGTRGRGFPKDPRDRQGVIDAVLEDTSKDGDDLDLANEKRLEELREKLGETKRRKDEKGGASAVLAARMKEGPELEVKKKTSKSDSFTKALKVIARGGSKKRSRSSDSSSAQSSLGGDDHRAGSSGSDLASKQRKLRRLAADKPGALLLRGYALMHEQLGSMYGIPGAERDPDKVLQPGAMRYLLTCALPLMDLHQLGEERIRELRTLATGLDLIVSGSPSATRAS